MTFAIETVGLTRTFGDFVAVAGVDLRVEKGCFFGFLGPNGAGKSTTIKMLTGLLGPTSGSVRILGHDLAREPLEVKRKIGVVPENLALFENLTAREFLTFVGRMHLLEKGTIRTRSQELLQVMELDREESRLVLEYSHGMRKKLALAAALLHDPLVLFLDEPFEGVDALASRTLRDLLARYVARGSTVFLTSHVLEIVEKLCTHVGIINRGQLVEQGPITHEGGSLEERFIARLGGDAPARAKLDWLDG
jgi:ABC-2 type transport system ATP-binding protein